MSKALADLIGGRDDADLLVRLRRRDPESVGILFDRYGEWALNLAVRILGNPTVAECVVAEASIKCWNRVASFRETRGGALGVWFLMTTYANALEHLGAPSSDPLFRPGSMERGTVFQDWSKRVNAETLQDTLLSFQQLTEQEKQLLNLAIFDGLTPNALAPRLNLTKPEVEQLIQSAMAKLGFSDSE